MKSLVLGLATLLLTVQAQADANCVANGSDMEGRPFAIPFLIDQESQATFLRFERPVSWGPQLVFHVIYTAQVGNIDVVVGAAKDPRKTQIVEIQFVRSRTPVRNGTMIAGDQHNQHGGVAKRRDYTVQCTSN